MPGSNKSSRKSSVNSTQSTSIKSPQTFDEFLKANNLNDWPEPLTSEGPLDIGDGTLGFGTLDDIYQTLVDAAPVDYVAFDDLATRLEDIENLLNKYADAILVRPGMEEPDNESENTFITETVTAETDTAEDQTRGRKRQTLKKTPKSELMSDIKKKSVDFFQFPGFSKNELIELPSQLEAPQILNEVTKAQNFNSGFQNFWSKIFLSEASVAVMQDLFWWFFLEKFDEQRRDDQLRLFDRIADSFVALFFSINPEVKDKFFQVYAECLAQAVYVAFYNAFPESTKKFDESFIDHLNCICVEWVSGVKPVPESWRRWDLSRLVQPPKTKMGDKKKEANSTAAAFHGGTSLSLDIDSFNKVINNLGADAGRSIAPSGLQINNYSAHTNRNTSKQSLYSDTPRREKATKCSHQIGPGPKFETVSFDTLGQSALVDHFLRQRKLQGDKRPQLKVKRTQVSKLPPATQTYQELIQTRTKKSEVLSRQYQLAVQENGEEIRRIQRESQLMNREINSLTRRVLFNKNPLDIKIMSEEILDMRQKPIPSMAINDEPVSDTDEQLDLE